MWHILFCSVHTSVNLQPHSKPTINSRKLCTQPLLVCSMLLLDISVVEACGGGRNSVFAVLENCLSQKKVLMQKFCFLLVCVYERTCVCRPTEMHVYLKEWGAELFRACRPELQASIQVADQMSHKTCCTISTAERLDCHSENGSLIKVFVWALLNEECWIQDYGWELSTGTS